jgi:hypothetical protein
MLCEIGEMEGIIQNGKAAGVHPQRPCFAPFNGVTGFRLIAALA